MNEWTNKQPNKHKQTNKQTNDQTNKEINSNKLHLAPELISIADYEITTIAIKFNSTLIIALGHYCTGALRNKLTIMIHVLFHCM